MAKLHAANLRLNHHAPRWNHTSESFDLDEFFLDSGGTGLHRLCDQLTPNEVLRDFTQRQGIRRVQGYARSHATILLTPTLYADYRAFLEEMKKPPRTK